MQQKLLLCSSIVTNVGKYWLLQKLQAVFARSLCLVIPRKALRYRCNMFRISWHVYSREMWINYNVQKFAFWWGMLSGRISIIKFDLAHVLIFFYMALSTPIVKATAFFTLHGIMTVFEIFIRHKFQVNVIKLVSLPITQYSLLFSALWLLYPSASWGMTDFKAISEFQDFFRKFLPQYYSS